MREDQIRELLQRADGEIEPRTVPAGALANELREIDRRRRRRRRVVAATLPLVLIAAAAVTWPWWHRGPAIVQTYPPTIADAAHVKQESGPDIQTTSTSSDTVQATPSPCADEPAELTDAESAQLAAEAELQLMVARRMIAVLEHERVLEETRRILAEEDPLDEARRRIDTVAYRMILRADRLRDTMQPPDEAIAIYEEVLQLFPTTYSAEVARERLAALMN